MTGMSKVEHINEESYPPGFHPALPPPVSERGLIKWVRESLFNNACAVLTFCPFLIAKSITVHLLCKAGKILFL